MTISREVLYKYLLPGDNFVETGTRWGDTVIRALERGGCGLVVSCEIDIVQSAIATAHVRDARPADEGRWEIRNQDSPDFLRKLSQIKDTVSKPWVFFLDAHSERHSPLGEELSVIERLWQPYIMTIMIDDVSCWGGWGINMVKVEDILIRMGYELRYEPGIVANDILVASKDFDRRER